MHRIRLYQKLNNYIYSLVEVWHINEIEFKESNNIYQEHKYPSKDILEHIKFVTFVQVYNPMNSNRGFTSETTTDKFNRVETKIDMTKQKYNNKKPT